MNLKQKIKSKFLRDIPIPAQYSLSITVLFGIALLGSWLNPAIGYRGVALFMLLAVSILAVVFDILPVLLAAVLSALTWNYFFIPPIYEFNFENKEDMFLFVMYFFIAMVNAALSLKVKDRRKRRKKLLHFITRF